MSAWSAPAGIATPNRLTASTPAVARGVDGDAAELAWVDAAHTVSHARLVGSTWTAPVVVEAGTAGVTHVAIATGP